MDYKEQLENFMDGLYEIGCVKFGEFELSTGLKTPVYFDLRLLVSHPRLLVRKFYTHFMETKTKNQKNIF